MEEKTKAPFWKPALIYGAIVGFVGILVGVIFYVMDMTAENWTNWVSLLISLIILVYCLVNYKKDHLGGYATFGQIWKMTLVIGIISTILGSLYFYILVTLDPEVLDKMKIAAEQRILDNPRIPEGYVDTALERVEKSMQIGRIIVMQFIFGPVMYAIIGLVLAAFIKKNDPAQEIA